MRKSLECTATFHFILLFVLIAVETCSIWHYYMTIFANGLEREIKQFDWFLNGLELAVPDSGEF